MKQEANIFRDWLANKHEHRCTPVKASPVIQSMQAETLLTPFLEASAQNHENLNILLHNITPSGSSAVATSKDMLSQHPSNSEALPQDFLSQNSNLSPSKDIHPEGLQFGTPSHGPATPAQIPERISQQTALPNQNYLQQKFMEATVPKVKAKESVNPNRPRHLLSPWVRYVSRFFLLSSIPCICVLLHTAFSFTVHCTVSLLKPAAR